MSTRNLANSPKLTRIDLRVMDCERFVRFRAPLDFALTGEQDRNKKIRFALSRGGFHRVNSAKLHRSSLEMSGCIGFSVCERW